MQDNAWQPIETAPKDLDILVHTPPWGSIIARFSEEFGQWLSRMQMPASIQAADELPTHWQPLPDAPVGSEAKPLARPAAI
ncbi:hypothetical protein [Enterovirga rhinocerotis]|uniref:DUF551 domain-containing protein n=1 Tax=Enterovirga rhinocerotis TaxID=1339210 RepID=A0A4R7CC87_9HYPH|nr:hypothetical protein [Enterovirga rhinocerotis]TDR94407.1 hypothetical protein EV668_1694 [Enterovirga rhinocerotis]